MLTNTTVASAPTAPETSAPAPTASPRIEATVVNATPPPPPPPPPAAPEDPEYLELVDAYPYFGELRTGTIIEVISTYDEVEECDYGEELRLGEQFTIFNTRRSIAEERWGFYIPRNTRFRITPFFLGYNPSIFRIVRQAIRTDPTPIRNHVQRAA